MNKMMKKLIFLVSLIGVSFCFSETTGTRILPVTYTPGGIITVRINVSVDPGVTGVIVKEYLPSDWIVSETMSVPAPAKLEFEGGNRIYSWLKFDSGGVSSFSITYKIYVPSSASGDYSFYGSVLTLGNPDGSEISGDNILRGNIGDINNDGVVDISDVILCLRMAIGLREPDIAKADLNNDGIVDISDVILVLRISIGLL